jgi:hypothetical protein
MAGNGLGAGSGLPPGGFDPDQCTGYADERRPDIHQYEVAHGVQAGGWNGNMPGIFAARAGTPPGPRPYRQPQLDQLTADRTRFLTKHLTPVAATV